MYIICSCLYIIFLIVIIVKISSKYKYPHAEVKLYYIKETSLPNLNKDNITTNINSCSYNNNSFSSNNNEMHQHIKKSSSMTTENLFGITPLKLSDSSRSRSDFNIGKINNYYNIYRSLDLFLYIYNISFD